jgi:hypothetical protein
MPKVYLETTISSYLTAWSSRDLIKAAHRQITREWWQSRARFALYISQLVLREASGSDVEAAKLRREVLKGIPVLALRSAASAPAEQLVQQGPLPENARADALYIGIATVNGMDYVLMWNCPHIANAALGELTEEELYVERSKRRGSARHS